MTEVAVRSTSMPSRIILVGRHEIADLLGVTVDTVKRWIAASDTTEFPAPEWRVSGTPIWRQTTITAWSRRTGYPKPLYNVKDPGPED